MTACSAAVVLANAPRDAVALDLLGRARGNLALHPRELAVDVRAGADLVELCLECSPGCAGAGSGEVFLPDVDEAALAAVVLIDLNQPMQEILATLALSIEQGCH